MANVNGRADHPSIDTEPTDRITTADRPAKWPVSVFELRKRLGQRQHESIEIELARRQVVSSWTAAPPVVGDLTIESIERGVTVRGQVSFSWEGECRRCLEVTSGTNTVDIDEIFQVNAPEDTELIDFDGDTVELLPIIRDAVVFSLPLAPLCRSDCPGPDPGRYPAVSADQHEVDQAKPSPDGDPRWAALDQLRFES